MTTRRGFRLHRVWVALLLVAVVVSSGTGASSAQEYGPQADGCFWFLEQGQWTQKRCPQSDESDYLFVPDGGEWAFAMECADTPMFMACLWASDLYTETYPDGSGYLETLDRRYVITHTDGSVAEAGYYDSSGGQRVYVGMSTTKNSLAMRNRSFLFWWYQGWAVQTVVQSNPAAFAGLITMDQASNEYASCLHVNDSSTDFDGDGRTGFNELAEQCTAQVWG